MNPIKAAITKRDGQVAARRRKGALLSLQRIKLFRANEAAELRSRIEKSLYAVGCDRISQDSGDVDIADELVRALAYVANLEFTMEELTHAAEVLESEGMAPFAKKSGVEPWIMEIQSQISDLVYMRSEDLEVANLLRGLSSSLTELRLRLDNSAAADLVEERAAE